MSEFSTAPGNVTSPVPETTIVRQVAHQIRQPLSVIQAIAYHLDLLLPDAGDAVQAQVGKLRQQAHEIDRILSDTIHYLQASPPRLRQTDLADLVSQHISDWAPAGDLNIEPRLTSGLPGVRLDIQQVQHLLETLLLLFGKIAPAKTPILLSVTANGTEAVLEFAAAISNYSAGEVTQMFEPFSTPGAGLKLASVSRIAGVHNARISVEPTATGGVSISVAFPA
jgi:signal transduction histidine kinase